MLFVRKRDLIVNCYAFLYILGDMSRQKILVYGITGMTGTRLAQILKDKFRIIGPPHSHLDLTSKSQVLKNIKDVTPDQIIYLAGVTKVDEAEQNKRSAFLLNARVPEYIAKISSRLDIPVNYISTDAVFDSKKRGKAYREEDKTNPLSVYGKSKLSGERAVFASSKQNSVIRTIMIYSSCFPHRKDFARSAYESLNYKKQFSGIVDQVVSPTFVDDLVWAIAAIIKKKPGGIYHVAATDYTTNYGFVKKIAKAFKLDEKLIRKTTFKEFFKDKPAPRQQYSVLSTTKFRKEFGHNILHSIDESIAVFKKQILMQDIQPVDI